MKGKLINKLSQYEIFLIEASGENIDRLPEMNARLTIQNGKGRHVVTFPFIEGMEKSELAEMIGAESIDEFDTHSGHLKNFDNSSINHEKLVDNEKYLVITKDGKKTDALIKKYKHENRFVDYIANQNHNLELIDNYKD